MRVAILCTGALLLASGCSLLNQPDRGKIGNDAGIDGAVPEGGLDGGRDAGCDGPCPRPEVCNDGLDNDWNGLTDCQDYACASEERCCVATTPQTYSFDEIDFEAVPSEAVAWPMVAGGQIVGLGTHENPKGIVLLSCTPMVTGVQISAQLGVRSGGNCGASLDSCYAKLVVTPSNDFLDGEGFLDELAVRLDSTGRLTVEQAGRVITTRGRLVGRGNSVHVRVQLGPGQGEGNAPAIVGTVMVDDEVLVTRRPVQRTDLLVMDSGCETNPGLFVGLEGRGDAVSVGALTTTQQECANPSHFARPDENGATLSRTHVGLGSWAQGGIAQPALVSTTNRWALLVDASDAARRNEELRDMGFALGYSFCRFDGWDTMMAWSTHTPMSTSTSVPLVGDCHASCFGSPPPGCTSECVPGPITSYREPSALPASSGELLLAFVKGVVGSPLAIGTGRFGSRSTDPLDDTPYTFAPGECTAVRSPSLVPAGPGADDDLWLFFTCEHGTAPSDIRVVGVQRGTLSFKPTVMVALEPSQVPEMGSLGVSSPEAFVEFGAEGPAPDGGVAVQATIRVWFTGLSPSGRTIGLAVGSSAAEADVPIATAMGRLQPYYDNPVLWADHPRLPECRGECYLEGMSVTRIHDGTGPTGRLRFLVARSVQTMSGIEYELAPVDQIWPAP